MKDLSYLPKKIKVKILQGKSGVFIAELPEYDAHTEADTLEELNFMINDLVFAIFDVPKTIQGLIRYVPEKPKLEFDYKKWFIFQKYISSEASHLFK